MTRNATSGAGAPLRWEIVEGEGIGPVRLGMTKRAVRGVLGEPNMTERAGKIGGVKTPAVDRFLGSAVQVEYVDQRVSFVGVHRGPEVDVVLRGVHVFDVLFRELAPWLASQVGVDPTDDDFPTAWVFPESALSLWRESDELEFATRPPAGAQVKASLRLDQIGIDKRFSRSPTRVKCGPMPAPRPGITKRHPSDVWREIDAMDPASRGWAQLVADLRSRAGAMSDRS